MAISELRDREQMIIDQILAAYSHTIDRMESGDLQGALKELGSLRELLLSETLDYLPTLVKRRNIELYIVDQLEHLIVSQIQAAKDNSARIVRLASPTSRGVMSPPDTDAWLKAVPVYSVATGVKGSPKIG